MQRAQRGDEPGRLRRRGGYKPPLPPVAPGCGTHGGNNGHIHVVESAVLTLLGAPRLNTHGGGGSGKNLCPPQPALPSAHGPDAHPGGELSSTPRSKPYCMAPPPPTVSLVVGGSAQETAKVTGAAAAKTWRYHHATATKSRNGARWARPWRSQASQKGGGHAARCCLAQGGGGGGDGKPSLVGRGHATGALSASDTTLRRRRRRRRRLLKCQVATVGVLPRALQYTAAALPAPAPPRRASATPQMMRLSAAPFMALTPQAPTTSRPLPPCFARHDGALAPGVMHAPGAAASAASRAGHRRHLSPSPPPPKAAQVMRGDGSGASRQLCTQLATTASR